MLRYTVPALLFALALAVTIADGKIYFRERFSDGDGWLKRWVYSKHRQDGGKFKTSAGKYYGDAQKDVGLQTSEDARFYALSAKLDEPIYNSGQKPLVVQYTVKHEQDIDCGGAYIKLFGPDLDQEDLHGESQYQFMFGPDICGPSNRRTHVIFNKEGQNLLIDKEIAPKHDVMTNLYTFIHDPTAAKFTVKINGEEVHSAAIEDSHSALPPKEIKDPEAKKPDDWDDRKEIDDPESTKPDDWDQPEHIADPDATRPDDWDDEMDGEWEPPMIDNPDYKGEWQPKKMDNPDYKGEWVHPMIKNKDYDPEAYKTLAVYPEGSHFIGLDLWQVKSGTIFDNFVVTDDVAEAEADATEFWAETVKGEKVMKEEQDKAKEEAMKAEMEKTKDEEIGDDDDDEDEDEEGNDEDIIEEDDAEDVEEEANDKRDEL